jgi:hypothetical protein
MIFKRDFHTNFLTILKLFSKLPMLIIYKGEDSMQKLTVSKVQSLDLRMKNRVWLCKKTAWRQD